MIRGFDRLTVIVNSMGRRQMIFKHAISTITPIKPLGTQPTEKPADKTADAKPEDTPTEEAKAE